ncbi:hypothetical protein [Prochlorothrix hollandica]|uniref:hypothetical protein n=1 Tax=Prochlorothrix hollandica TaxID=1223 RepID=UPI000349839E|nr:hypothetical protein [Prochlorothrix hollandica]
MSPLALSPLALSPQPCHPSPVMESGLWSLGYGVWRSRPCALNRSRFSLYPGVDLCIVV